MPKFSDVRSSYWLEEAEVDMVNLIYKVLAIFNQPTIELQAVQYPTLPKVLPKYLKLKAQFEALAQEPKYFNSRALSQGLRLALEKLTKYLNLDKDEFVFTLILDPRIKALGLPKLGFTTRDITKFIRRLQVIYETTAALYPPSEIGNPS